MLRSLPLPFAPLLGFALAACGQPAGNPAPGPTTPAANAYAAKVAGLPPQQRAGVLLRAIRDAGQDCQRIDEATAAPGSSPPAWVATCDARRRWVVAIAADGTATVVDAKDLAAHP